MRSSLVVPSACAEGTSGRYLVGDILNRGPEGSGTTFGPNRWTFNTLEPVQWSGGVGIQRVVGDVDHCYSISKKTLLMYSTTHSQNCETNHALFIIYLQTTIIVLKGKTPSQSSTHRPPRRTSVAGGPVVVVVNPETGDTKEWDIHSGITGNPL